ncbi:MAG: DUF423 domain-containing protein [Betaproteobacteria bacterium]|jgi:uncharacterized membrane protein YgdD (TMEM256/DUF423 family)|nr:DUF423 domain-containing protein [Pseudomonadota bacterium]NBO02591.1 DUF423 domain-containing protein [Betaproteobacteria bacterium]NBO95033.1 DUF423 domain-containing protein [Betaproteobacteria bacterium]NBP34344.1 DUF423 domain-containing protein [Betaproteobacteria bacterium]NBP37016.1 DUF423 domain-containing protein [Betaproteobacteria bacterium]
MPIDQRTKLPSINKTKLVALAFALINGMLAVLASALASHALAQKAPSAQLAFDIAARLHLIHSVLMLVFSLWWLRMPRFSLGLACVLLGLGIMLFSMTIYARVLIGDSFVSRLTPLGGLLLMAGWLSPLPVVIDLWRQTSKSVLRS